jgi:hypothetical protein
VLLQRRYLVAKLCIVGTVVAIAACADVTTSDSVPASIEFKSFAAPAVVVGDTLRNIDGEAAPAVAIVRNQRGDILEDAVVRYTYADAGRDTALFVDSLSGFVVSLRALTGTGTMLRVAARVGENLQVLRTVLVTTRPDTADGPKATDIDTLKVAPPDTGTAAVANTSEALTVTVRHVEVASVRGVPNYLVRYELLEPANPTNDSTMGAFLVNDVQKLSNIDTTDGTGTAVRFVRVRASLFPTSAAPDSAVVRVTVNYQGKPIKGTPIRIVVPVVKKP